ncbi:hypothetical protein PPNK14_11660 [Pectobacterium parmentieri]
MKPPPHDSDAGRSRNDLHITRDIPLYFLRKQLDDRLQCLWIVGLSPGRIRKHFQSDLAMSKRQATLVYHA